MIKFRHSVHRKRLLFLRQWLWVFFVLVTACLGALSTAKGLVSDSFVDESMRSPRSLKLGRGAERQADAMAHYITGVFEEEQAGPEKALESYKKVLELDPGYGRLAIEVAFNYLRHGQSADAIGVLKDALKASPNDAELALALSSIYLRYLRKPELAQRFAQTALQLSPKAFGPYEALWEIAQVHGDRKRALQVLDRALKSDSKDPSFWLQLAEFYAGSIAPEDGELRNTEAIEACLKAALKLGADDPEVLVKVADFYTLDRQYEKAMPLYRQAYERKTLLPNIREKLAQSLIRSGKGEEAIPILEEILESNPLDLSTYDQLSELYRKQGAFEKATAALEQALLIDKTNWIRHRDLAVLLLQLKKFDAAAARIGEARRLFPHVAFFSYLHALAFRGAKRNEEALRAFEETLVEAANAQPDLLSGEFYLDYALAAAQAQRPQQAEALFRKAIEADPFDLQTIAEAQNGLGYMWAERGENLEEADQLIQQALQLQPKNGAFFDSLGWVYFKKAQYDQALLYLLQAEEILKDSDPLVYEHIGDTYQALSKLPEALSYWKRALALEPRNERLREKVRAVEGAR